MKMQNKVSILMTLIILVLPYAISFVSSSQLNLNHKDASHSEKSASISKRNSFVNLSDNLDRQMNDSIPWSHLPAILKESPIAVDAVRKTKQTKSLSIFKGVFHGIGGISFPFVTSEASAASKNGVIVVGSSEAINGIDDAFRWNGGVLEALGTTGNLTESIALDVSKDGEVAVGYATTSIGLFEAVRWSEGQGMERLGFISSDEGWSEAFAVSGDGKVVVGGGNSDRGNPEAFCWIEGDGMIGLGDLPGGGFSSRAFGVSANGSVVVGEGESDSGVVATIWTRQEGMNPLLSGGNYDYSSARAVSADGSVVAGQITSNNGTFTEAFLMDRDQAKLEHLGHLPGGRHDSRARDISPDGAIVIGTGHTGATTGGGFEAFIWTNSLYGMRNLGKVLTEVYGLDLSGWTLNVAKGISVSDRGITTIVGNGTNPEGKSEGWRAALPVFPGVGDLAGANFHSVVQAISEDGSVVVGSGTSSGTNGEAFLWKDDIPEGIGGIGGNIESDALDVSANGSVIVGESQSASGIGVEAFRWTQTSGMVGLGDLPGGHEWPFSRAQAVSANGNVVVGRGESDEGFEAFRWEDGTMQNLGDFPGGRTHSEAQGVSDDGRVVVGRSLKEAGFEAFRWTEETGMVGLGDLSGGQISSVANGVSADGSVIVGSSSSENGMEAFRWTEETGMVGLGDLPGEDFSSVANAVSHDGTIVVGKSQSTKGSPFGTEAFIWTEEAGMQNLKELAQKAYGAVLKFWVLAEATDVTVIGNTAIITGIGMNPLGLKEGFRIPLPGIVNAKGLFEMLPINDMNAILDQ